MCVCLTVYIIFLLRCAAQPPRPGVGGAGASAANVLPIDVPAMSLTELNRLTFNFGDRALVSEGSYGRVYRATLATGEAVAVKRFNNGSASGQSEAEFREQLSVASRLKCDCFTQLLGYCLELNNRIVVCQFATLGSLYDILHGKKGPVLTWGQRARIAYGAARGLECLHEKARPPIVHRDVRSRNVLVFDGYEAKIGDFNLTNQSPDSASRLHSTKVLGTFGYHAPE
jgi:serine/threonine protein kinase